MIHEILDLSLISIFKTHKTIRYKKIIGKKIIQSLNLIDQSLIYKRKVNFKHNTFITKTRYYYIQNALDRLSWTRYSCGYSIEELHNLNQSWNFLLECILECILDALLKTQTSIPIKTQLMDDTDSARHCLRSTLNHGMWGTLYLKSFEA